MNGSDSSERPAIAVISSHVTRGSVGTRAMAFALETLGFPVWEVITVSLPWHPGHGPAPRLVPPAAEFQAYMEALSNSPRLSEIGAVLTGYLGASDQAAPIAAFVAAVKQANPAALHVCDPTIGDQRGLYVPSETAAEIRDRLFAVADIVTPNRFEFAWLTDSDAESNEAIAQVASELAASSVLVTSAHPLIAGGIGNLLVADRETLLAEHRLIPDSPNGTGDLLAAVFLARMLTEKTPAKALEKATATVFEAVARACKRGADELMLATDAPSLVRPMAMVQMRHLARRPTPPRSA